MKPLSDLTAHCIRCGFCLESCPTYVITGKETESPRGRIYLIRSADEGVLEWDRQVKRHIDTCLGCRACEPACPSGVQYGQILELARDRLEKEAPHRSKKWLLGGMTSPTKLRRQLLLGKLYPGRRIPSLLSRILCGEPPQADMPRVQPKVFSSAVETPDSKLTKRGEVYLLEGCAMRVLFPRVHEATRRLLKRVGFDVRESEAGCCGALHAHNGYLSEARAKAAKLIGDLPDDIPIIVNSAGCGATMKHYAELLDASHLLQARRNELSAVRPRNGLRKNESVSTDRARHFAGRVLDASEFLLEHDLIDLLRKSKGLDLAVTYHDACHLAHGQGITQEPLKLIEAIPGIKLIPLSESDMCCGSAGIYNLVQPNLARELLDRKWRNIEATAAGIVVTGNPGCHAWIDQASREHGGKVSVLHTMELLEASFSGLDGLQLEEKRYLAIPRQPIQG